MRDKGPSNQLISPGSISAVLDVMSSQTLWHRLRCN